jgi:ribonuclease J
MVKVIPLGGVGEIGLNMMVIEHGDDILVVDAGLMFPDEYMPGVDLVIPDFQYLRENRERVKWIILTHGHEDHIGAMPFFLREFPVPVYGSRFTLELLKEKLKEHQLSDQVDLNRVDAGEKRSFGPFEIEFMHVNHSIIEGLALAIRTPEGILVHSGDFKIDPTPVDGLLTDLPRFAHYGEEGVLAFFSDSTNAEKDGFTLSESQVRKTLAEIIEGCNGRVIVAMFASNISRIQQIINLAVEFGRKVVFNGKSMIVNVNIARREGIIHLPQDVEIGERQIGQYQDKQIAIITTGSQGEPMSALTRMAQERHKNIKIKPGDTIILSSKFIPGNEKAIATIINSLYRMGAEVVYEKVSAIHTSGHANREELKLMLSLVKPKLFIPIHGECRHLMRHLQLAKEMGIPSDRALLAENGVEICFENGKGFLGERVQSGRVFVDGKGVGDVGELVLRDRRRLSEHGMVIVLLTVDEKTGNSIYGPDIISRGFVFEDQSRFILEEAKGMVLEIMDELVQAGPVDWPEVESEIERRLKKFFYNVIERRPLILPLIVTV